jgi:hypothetical protein
MRPPFEFPARVTDGPAGIRGSIWVSNEAIPVLLLHLYILRYERQFFTVVLQDAKLIHYRIGYESDESPDGCVEWSSSGPLILLETEELGDWLYHLRPHFYEDRSRMIFEMCLVGDDSNTGKSLDLEVRIGQPPSMKARR